MKLTPAQVKNLMRRGLRFIVDPEPEKEQKLQVREHFRNQCAYCQRPLEYGDGDIDHLVSAALGGSNGLANRVLSCKPCNAEEKRDRDWIEFLHEKAPSQDVFQARKKQIEDWIQLNGGHVQLDASVMAAINEESKRTTVEYDLACRRIRKMKNGQQAG